MFHKLNSPTFPIIHSHFCNKTPIHGFPIVIPLLPRHNYPPPFTVHGLLQQLHQTSPQSHWRMLEDQPQLGGQPPRPGRLRRRVWQWRIGRQIRVNLRGHRPVGRPGIPEARNAAFWGDPRGAIMDCIRKRYGDYSGKRADGEQLQDHWRARG